MAVKKLTLSAPEETIADAKRIATQNNTSVSALFTRLIRSVDKDPDPKIALGPITLRASGMVKWPSNQTDQNLLEEALSEKYGLSS